MHYAKPFVFPFLSTGLLQVVDACQPIEDVEKQLQEIVLSCVTECQKGRALSSLWST
jgi:hypothetical protein